MSIPDGDVTVLLKAMNRGDKSAADQLLPLVYSELHRLAKGYMSRERRGHTLQPTALINQAYLRIAQQQNVEWQNHAHFIGFAANVMRRVLVDHAREHNAAMRGGGRVRVELDEGIAFTRETAPQLLLLEEALTRLEQLNPRQAKVVEMRYFGGLSVEEVAGVLGIAPRSVKRDWSLARLWLFEEIQKGAATAQQ
ncbi:sigma-70 family RNA polymerase sigma factor [Edaphobacter aggregans]|uniref:sigma-70 family RNA polymerase sigma factor n=1 Tax=Edaphobacter aggregans TaxID=570835 RepID=UPI0005551ACB|nr:sigma-70 family RNA polymerase sigma factor [Edaphobacter aggregans]